MRILVGLAIVFGSLVYGYTMHGGQLTMLMQTAWFIVIGGACLGALIIGNKPAVLRRVVTEVLALLKPSPLGKEAFLELLQVLYDVFYAARKEGLVGIEPHVEKPEKSELFKKHKTFYGKPEAMAFLADTLKVLLAGAVDDHHLAEILELDLKQRRREAKEASEAVHVMADALPGFGIVAAVLGVLIAVGAMGSSSGVVGTSVAAALVGVLFGVLLAYAMVRPVGKAMSSRTKGEETYLSCIRTALLSFARGDSPITSVEFARRSIEPSDRPSFQELEELTRRREKPTA